MSCFCPQSVAVLACNIWGGHGPMASGSTSL